MNCFVMFCYILNSCQAILSKYVRDTVFAAEDIVSGNDVGIEPTTRPVVVEFSGSLTHLFYMILDAESCTCTSGKQGFLIGLRESIEVSTIFHRTA